MSISCPISNRRVDANMARTVSLQVALFTILFLLTNWFYFAFFVLFDFSLRALKLETFSPFYRIGAIVLNALNVEPTLCDELPKRFALYMGFSVAFVIVLSYLLKFYLFSSSIATILVIFALLEALLGFCMGCKIYYVIQMSKRFLNGRNIK